MQKTTVLQQERFQEAVDARTTVCYENQGVYIPISRLEMKKGMKNDKNRSIQVHFGDFSVESTIGKFGEDMDGANHFMEHVLSRVIDLALVGPDSEVSRLVEMFPELHVMGIQRNASTSLTGMSFELSVPYDFEYGRVLGFLNAIFSDDIDTLKPYFDQAIAEEISRVRNELEIFSAESEIQRFIAKYVYTKDSIDNIAIGILGRNPRDLDKIDSTRILELIKTMAADYPIVVSIHNPPDDISDDDLVETVSRTVGDRSSSELIPERDLVMNEYKENGWIHLEHYRLPINGTWNSRLSIPITNMEEKDLDIWLLVSDAFFFGAYAPFPNLVQRIKKLGIYKQKTWLARSTTDLITEVDINPYQLASFVDILESFILEDNILEDFFRKRDELKGNSYFDYLKKRRLRELGGGVQIAHEVAKDLRHYGRPKRLAEGIDAYRSISEYDVRRFFDKLREGLKDKRLLTTSNIHQRLPKVEELAQINDRIPFSLAAQSVHPMQPDNVTTDLEYLIQQIGE